MARQYSRRTFLRQTPRSVLKEYFARNGLLGQIVELCSGKHPAQASPPAETVPAGQSPGSMDKAMEDAFDAMKKRKGAEGISDAIEKLPDAQRDTVEADFEQVNEMAYERGVEAILEEATFRNLGWADKFAKMENHYERAFRAFLDNPDLFYVAGHFDEMDRVGYSERRTIDKNLVPKVEEADLTALKEAIKHRYKGQGRGRRCAVDNYLRRNPERHCYFVYPEDHPVTELSFDSRDTLHQVPRRPVFEIIFVYRPESGALELSARGNREHREELLNAFCQAILGLPKLPDSNAGPDYDLSSLKKRETAFPTDPGDGIEAVEVKMLRLDLAGSRFRRITFEANPSRNTPQAIYDLIDQSLDVKKVSLDSVHVAGARLRLTFAARNGGRQKKLTFEIAHPNRCTLKDNRYDQIAKKYLKQWKIARE